MGIPGARRREAERNFRSGRRDVDKGGTWGSLRCLLISSEKLLYFDKEAWYIYSSGYGKAQQSMWNQCQIDKRDHYTTGVPGIKRGSAARHRTGTYCPVMSCHVGIQSWRRGSARGAGLLVFSGPVSWACAVAVVGRRRYLQLTGGTQGVPASHCVNVGMVEAGNPVGAP